MPFRGIGPWEIGLILVIILIVFGVGKLPQVGKAVGKSIRAFKEGQQEEDVDEEDVVKPRPRKTARKKADVEKPAPRKTARTRADVVKPGPRKTARKKAVKS